ncbi:MAG: hypothetical protein F4052_00705 [Dehalococcoidia bacterium]|nr:hypothetical protein [Dehalococcoidia bacterium]
MPYYIHEDTRGEGYVRLHSALCGHCQRGVERQARSLTGNTFTHWHGPYETFEQALFEGERLGLPVEGCRSCLPPGAPE